MRIGLLLGIGEVIAPILIEKRMFNKEGILLLAVSALFYAFASDKSVSRTEGIILLLIFAGYIFYLIETDVFHNMLSKFFAQLVRAKVKDGITELKENYRKYTEGLENGGGKMGLKSALLQILIIALSCAGLYFSSIYLIPAAKNIALAIKVPETVIGVTMLAIGTSIPELAVTVSAARKGKGNLLVGNLIGCNLNNILLVIGASSVITPLVITSGITFYYLFPVMLLTVILLLIFIRTNWVVRMIEGLLLLAVYALFIGVLFYLLKTGIWASL